MCLPTHGPWMMGFPGERAPARLIKFIGFAYAESVALIVSETRVPPLQLFAMRRDESATHSCFALLGWSGVEAW